MFPSYSNVNTSPGQDRTGTATDETVMVPLSYQSRLISPCSSFTCLKQYLDITLRTGYCLANASDHPVSLLAQIICKLKRTTLKRSVDSVHASWCCRLLDRSHNKLTL